MENMVEAFNKVLCDVRKAHRLIFEYQMRMLSLVNFIRHKLDFNTMCGVKHFSNPIATKRDGFQRIHENMWAWDFIYSYIYEFYIGEKLEDNSNLQLSIIQYSDTGYFDNENNDRCATDNFSTEEDAISKIMFAFEIIPPKCKPIWNNTYDLQEYIMNKEYASKRHTHTILYPKGKGKNILVFYSMPLSRFINEKSSTEALKEFVEFCKDKNLVKLSMI